MPPTGPHLGKGALAIHHKQRRLAAATITHDHYLQLLPCGAGGSGWDRGTWGVHSPEPAARWMLRSGQSPVERQGGGGAAGRGYEAPPSGSCRHFCQAASRVPLVATITLCYVPSPGCLSLSPGGNEKNGGTGC